MLSATAFSGVKTSVSEWVKVCLHIQRVQRSFAEDRCCTTQIFTRIGGVIRSIWKFKAVVGKQLLSVAPGTTGCCCSVETNIVLKAQYITILHVFIYKSQVNISIFTVYCDFELFYSSPKSLNMTLTCLLQNSHQQRCCSTAHSCHLNCRSNIGCHSTIDEGY